ncbi:MAG TPA: histidine phosphatase family protein [Streptosporangiaceae bacterium]|nr:histidine phosphatase family protein [Streptosporangiaceae bacterium]
MLWRHGQTTFNAERRFQGQLDVPLNDRGRQQAALAARYIAAMGPGAIFSSDLSRAAETASALSRLTGLSVKLDPDLRERAGGEWEGLSDVELREQYGDAYSNWTSAPASWGPPAGESGHSVAERASGALLRVADSVPAGSTAVVVSHGGALGLATSRLLAIPEGVRMLGTLGNCRWSVLGRRNSKWRLLEHNVGSLPEPVADVEAEVPVEAGAEDGTRREE